MEVTEADKAQVEATQDVSRFLEDPEGLRIFNVLLSLRRAYVVAYSELQKMLDTPKDDAEYHPLSCDIIVQSAMHAAAKPFQEKQLFTGLHSAVLPWLQEKMAEHSKIEEEQLLVLEQRRRETPVPLGFRLPSDTMTLARDRSLTLAGDPTQISALLNATSAAAEVAGMVVIRFGMQPEPDKQSAMYCSFSAEQWKDVAKNPSTFGKFTSISILKQMDVPPDLVIVDDLALAHPELFVGQPVGATAGNAHKVIWRMCQQLGSALLGAVPTTDSDITGPEYEQLRVFSQLRRVDENGNIT